MKRSKLIFTIIALTTAAVVPTWGSHANGKLDEILANMQKAAGSITAIQTKMDQLKHNLDIGGFEKYTGEIFFKHTAKGNDMQVTASRRPDDGSTPRRTEPSRTGHPLLGARATGQNNVGAEMERCR